MSRFSGSISIFAAGLLVAAAPIVAAEYRYDVWSNNPVAATGRIWAEIPVNPAYSIPADSAGPPGIRITYPSSPGTDSVYWRVPRSGVAGRTCLACQSAPPWLLTILTSQPGVLPFSLGGTGTIIRDTQLVTVGGVGRTYVRTYGAWEPMQKMHLTFLSGIGPVYFLDNYVTGSPHSTYSRSFRLLEHDGVNIDTLWGKVLTPVAIAPRGTPRAAQSRFAARRFDLHEMGVFLGRKAALDRSKPLPAGVK